MLYTVGFIFYKHTFCLHVFLLMGENIFIYILYYHSIGFSLIRSCDDITKYEYICFMTQYFSALIVSGDMDCPCGVR